MEYHLSDKELQQFRERLETDLQQVQEALTRLQENEMPEIGLGEERNDSYGDDAKVSQIRDRIIFQMERKQKQAQELQAALLRVENKTFGICLESGELISKERLDAKPTATTCLSTT